MPINQLQCVKLHSLKCQSFTMCSNYIHRSLMSAVVGRGREVTGYLVEYRCP